MQATMKKYLFRCSGHLGGVPGGTRQAIEDHKQALAMGLITFSGAPQNSTTMRYRLTPAGEKALAAA